MQDKLKYFDQNSNLLFFMFFSIALLMGFFGLVEPVFADGPAVPAGSTPAPSPGTQGGPQQPGWGSMLMPFLLMFGVIYFLMIRPQHKKMKQHQDMLSKLERGDDVVTASGMLGKVKGITEKVVTLEVDSNVHVKMMKNQISQVVKGQVKDLA